MRKFNHSSEPGTLPSAQETSYRAARADLKRGVRSAKLEKQEKNKMENLLSNKNPRQVCQGIQHITNQKDRNATHTSMDVSLAEDLNRYLAPGPDGVPRKVLKVCTDQLCTVFTDIFNQSLTQEKVPQNPHHHTSSKEIHY